MDFIWNDGGRATSGFVGSAGDCVPRSIAIGSGLAYRDVYDAIGKRTAKSPRGGVETTAAEAYLDDLGWTAHSVDRYGFDAGLLALGRIPKGIVIVDLVRRDRKGGHYCCLVDHVVHDTWNPMDDGVYFVAKYFTPPASDSPATDGSVSVQRTGTRPSDQRDALTQKQFDKILRRLRALENTASNVASTDGEKRNAINMMKNLMLAHNLSQDDITDAAPAEGMCFTRRACPLNGRRAATWEKELAWYLVHEIFPNVQWYMATQGHRTMFWFYGPATEVENTIELFRELVVTIAAAAKLRYRSWSRGSGASYAEGYVAGLPREGDQQTPDGCSDGEKQSQIQVIQSRALAIHSAARDWLALECGTRLTKSSVQGRSAHDSSAASVGKKDGAQHDITPPGRQKRIT
ncbi:MAG: DUF2786 domain-containing protein [Aureliella sp.]